MGLAGTHPDCEPGGLVLCGQTGVAGESDLQLSALDDSIRPIRSPTAGWWRAPDYARRFILPTIYRARVEVAVLFYVATLSPLLGFIMLYTFGFRLWPITTNMLPASDPSRWRRGASPRRWDFGEGKIVSETGALRVLLLTLGVLTWRQGGMYADMETLWRTTLARNPIPSGPQQFWQCFFQKGRWTRPSNNIKRLWKFSPAMPWLLTISATLFSGTDGWMRPSNNIKKS